MYINWIKKHKNYVLLGVLAIVFFFVYLFLYITLPNGYSIFDDHHLILNQPDEAVNYFFIKNLVLEGNFRYPEGLSAFTLNQVHPRSTTVVFKALTPIGFPGIILLFGFVIKFFVLLFGQSAINFVGVSLTPLIAVITPLFFYGFLKKIFEEKIALLSSILLYIMPAWWYYASRPFQHNILFIGLLAVGLFVGALALEKEKLKGLITSFGFGLFYSLAVYVRPSEAVWMFILGLVLLILTRKKWDRKKFFAMFCGIGFVALLFFITQILYYGEPFASGYVIPQADGAGGIIFSGPQGIHWVKSILLPFGFSVKGILKNVFSYLILLPLAWFITTLSGLLLEIRNKKLGTYILTYSQTYKGKVYLFTYIFISTYLIIYYGSWIFTDNLLGMPSIGTSYVRYFLPIYVFSLPFVSLLLIEVYKFKKFAKLLTIFFVILLFLNSVYTVYFSLEGLNPVRKVVANFYNQQKQVYGETENNSIIVTRYGDKYIFPGRKVIAGFENNDELQAVKNMLDFKVPVYLFDLKLTSDEEDVFTDFGLKIEDPLFIFDNLELRKIEL